MLKRILCAPFLWWFSKAKTVWHIASSLFKRQASTPVVWLIFAAALFATQAVTFFIGDLLGNNDASLRLFFGYLPFVLVMFIPLLVAGGWAAERKDGMASWLSAQPVSPFFYDVGVYKGYVLLFLVWLVGSLTLPLTLGFLGDLDWALALSGYLAALLLGQVFIALSFWIANYAKSTLGAYGGGVLGGILLLLTAAEGLMLLAPFPVPAVVQNALLTFSPMHIYERMYQGFIVVADVLWLIALMIAFVLLGHYARRTQLGLLQKSGFYKGLSALVLLCGIGAGLVCKASFDVGGQGQFKPSPAAFEVLEPLPQEGVRIEVFFSAENLAMPGALRAFGRQVIYYLEGLAAQSEKVTLKVIDPTKNPSLEKLAQTRGLEPHVLPDGARTYLGVVIMAGTQSIAMPALLLPRRHLFEFDLMNNISRLRHDKTRRIAVVTGLNMADEKQRPAFLEMLSPFYRVDVTNHANAMIPDENDLVIVYNDALLSSTTLYALDQYVLRGGRVLILVDPFWFTAPTGRLQTTPNESPEKTLSDLLRHWGFGYDPLYILADEALGSPVQITDSAGVATHPLWIKLHSGEINQAHPIGQGLSELSLAASGVLRLNPEEGLQAVPILKSSGRGALFPRRLVYQADLGTLNHYYEDGFEQRVIAGAIRGVFKPFYPTRPPIVQDWFAEEGVKWPPQYIAPHKTAAISTGEVIVVTDIDMFHPQLAAISNSLEPANDNFNFIFNTVRYLLDEPEALRVHLRQKAGKRPLVMLEKILTQLSQTISGKEVMLINELTTLRAELIEKKQKLSLSSVTNPLIAEDIQALELKELKVLHKLDDVRQTAAKKARYFISLVTGFNLFGGGVFFIILGAFFRFWHLYWLRRRFPA